MNAGATEALANIVERLEAIYDEVEVHLAAKFPDPALVSDASTGRFLLLDALVVIVNARVALVNAAASE